MVAVLPAALLVVFLVAVMAAPKEIMLAEALAVILALAVLGVEAVTLGLLVQAVVVAVVVAVLLQMELLAVKFVGVLAVVLACLAKALVVLVVLVERMLQGAVAAVVVVVLLVLQHLYGTAPAWAEIMAVAAVLALDRLVTIAADSMLLPTTTLLVLVGQSVLSGLAGRVAPHRSLQQT